MLWPVSSKSRSVILLRWGRSLQNVCLSAQPARSLRNRKSSVSCRKEPINRHHCRYPSFRCQPCHWSCQPRRGFSRRGHDRWGGTKLRHCPCIGGRPWRRNQDISLGPVQWGLGSGSLCISKGEQVSAQLDERRKDHYGKTVSPGVQALRDVVEKFIVN